MKKREKINKFYKKNRNTKNEVLCLLADLTLKSFLSQHKTYEKKNNKQDYAAHKSIHPHMCAIL